MIKKIFVYGVLGCFLAQPTIVKSGVPLLEVVQVGRDAVLNVKKNQRFKTEKKIQAACAKGKFLSLRNNTLRSKSGKYCDGAAQGAYALLMCDTGKDPSFYKSKCFKKAVASLNVSNKGNNAADRKARQNIAKKVFFDNKLWASASHNVLMCNTLFKPGPNSGATHATIEAIHVDKLKQICVPLIGSHGVQTFKELEDLSNFLRGK